MPHAQECPYQEQRVSVELLYVILLDTLMTLNYNKYKF